jgi:DNA gyrase inhibitor GyrI
MHANPITEKDGEVIVTQTAGGGAVVIKFYTNYDKYHE